MVLGGLPHKLVSTRCVMTFAHSFWYKSFWHSWSDVLGKRSVPVGGHQVCNCCTVLLLSNSCCMAEVVVVGGFPFH